MNLCAGIKAYGMRGVGVGVRGGVGCASFHLTPPQAWGRRGRKGAPPRFCWAVAAAPHETNAALVVVQGKDHV